MPKKKKAALATTSAVAPPYRYKDHAYLNPDGSVDGEKLLSIVRRMPGGFDVMMLDAMLDKKPSRYHEEASEIIERLCNIIMFAAYGDEECETLMTAIRKMSDPRMYEVPQHKIRDITRYETRPPLARAWEMYRIMSHLTRVVEPLKSVRPFKENHPVKMLPGPTHGYHQSFWDLAKKHWRPNTTLQSLAITIYLEHLERQGVISDQGSITVRSLKRDLEMARAWETGLSDDEKQRRKHWSGGIIGDLTITWYEFSEGWKVRAKEKAAKQAGGKDRKKLT